MLAYLYLAKQLSLITPFGSQNYPPLWFLNLLICISSQWAMYMGNNASPANKMPVSRTLMSAFWCSPKQISLVAALEKLHTLVPTLHLCFLHLCAHMWSAYLTQKQRVTLIAMLMMMTIAIMMIVMTIAIMLSNAMMMMTAAGCTAFLPWAAFVKCHRGAKFTFTNDSTPAPQPHYITFTFNVKNVKIL